MRSCSTERGEWVLDASDVLMAERVAKVLPQAREVHALLITAPDRLDAASCFDRVASVLHTFRCDELHAVRLRGGGAAAVATLLPPTLPALALEHVRLDAHGGAAALDTALALLTSGLRSLELHSCRIRRLGAKRIAPRLGALQHLTRLSISNTPCIDELTADLAALTALRVLRLGAWLTEGPGHPGDPDDADDPDDPEMPLCAIELRQPKPVAARVTALQALTRLEISTPVSRTTAVAFLRCAVRLPRLAELALQTQVTVVLPFLGGLRKRGVTLRLRIPAQPSLRDIARPHCGHHCTRRPHHSNRRAVHKCARSRSTIRRRWHRP
jgi:hypothetical protein